MAAKKFTAREMDRLRESPYVLDVTQSIVHFSAQFKALFYECRAANYLGRKQHNKTKEKACENGTNKKAAE